MPDVERMPLPDEWMIEDIGQAGLNEQEAYRAVLSMEHLIRDNYSNERLNIVEIGPFPAVGDPSRHTAPISVMSRRNPEHNYISFGAADSSEYSRKKVLGDVEYIQGMLSDSPGDQTYIELLMKRLGGVPDIVYGQHVFEASRNTPQIYLPAGSFIPFEKSAEILKDGGFIIVDNHSGETNKIGMDHSLRHSSRMKLAYSYVYDIEENDEFTDPIYGNGVKVRGIYVMRKMSEPVTSLSFPGA